MAACMPSSARNIIAHHCNEALPGNPGPLTTVTMKSVITSLAIFFAKTAYGQSVRPPPVCGEPYGRAGCGQAYGQGCATRPAEDDASATWVLTDSPDADIVGVWDNSTVRNPTYPQWVCDGQVCGTDGCGADCRTENTACREDTDCQAARQNTARSGPMQGMIVWADVRASGVIGAAYVDCMMPCPEDANRPDGAAVLAACDADTTCAAAKPDQAVPSQAEVDASDW